MSNTLARLFRQAVSYDKPDMMLAKSDGRYRPISGREIYRRVGRLFHELRRAGIAPGDRCALLAENRWEWAVADFAMMTAGVVSVPVYPTLPAEQVHYLLEHSEARAIFVSTVQQLEKVQSIWDRLPALEGIILFDALDQDALDRDTRNRDGADPRIAELGVLIGETPLGESEREEFESAINSVRPEDLASIIYTSGTTGTPKGVMLSHGNFRSNVRDAELSVDETDVALSFLPLCHVAERMADYKFFQEGATVAYAESIDAVAQNLLEVRPTIAVGVPRFFEKIYDKVHTAVGAAPLIRRKLFHWAIGVGKAAIPCLLEGRRLPARLRLKHWIASRLVFQKLRARLGGRIRFFISGAAPLPLHVGEFFLALGVKICEAYGLTETSPVLSINHPEAIRPGTVGKVIPNVELKIAEDGEILARGPNIMQGYYKMPELTAESMADGWFQTGDIGKFDSDGYLTITDRKKDLLKTSGGKYIAPQPIESQLKTSSYVTTAVVIAEGRKFPSALIVPNFDKLKQLAAEKGITAASQTELAQHAEIRAVIEQEVESACAGMARYEQIKKIAILYEEFSIEKGEITPTMKVRRREVERIYADRIDEIYS